MHNHQNRVPPRPGLAARRALGWLLTGCLLGLGLAGCGAGVDSKGVQDPGGPPTGIDEAALQFERAEQDLRDSMLITGLDRHDRMGGPPAQPGYAQPPPPPSVGGTHESVDRRDRCEMACRALASMERSADRLCSLAGDQDSRCTNVRHRVRAARRLVRLWCPDCQT